MKLILSLLLFVGVAWSNSTSYYGWKPNKEYVFRYESQVLTSIPEIKETQRAGIRLSSMVRVQTFKDYSLRIKFEDVKFLTLNGEVRLSETGRILKPSKSDLTEQGELQESEIPQEIRQYLEKPFLVHLKRGVVESFYVERSEPAVVTNIKRSLLSQLQIDITGLRRSEIETNHIPVKNGMEREDAEIPIDSLQEVSYFITREETILGDCQTSYNIYPLPEYRAEELEKQWKIDHENLYLDNPEESRGEEICSGKKYFRITKNKNFDNCLKRPVGQVWTGLQSKCDVSKAACVDFLTQLSTTTYIVCGELEDFVIRKILAKNSIVTNPMPWNSEENIKNVALVSVELLKEESPSSPIEVPSETRKEPSLIFEYLEPTGRGEQGNTLPVEARERVWKKTGLYPFLPMPGLRSKLLSVFDMHLKSEEIIRQTIELLKKMSVEVFESPESCSSSTDVAGYLSVVSKYLVSLNFEELKNLESEVMRSLSGSQEGTRMAIKSLFYDVLGDVGTNPAVMLIKELIEQRKVDGRLAVNLLQSALRSVKTPTEELLKELVQLVKRIKSLHWERETFGFSVKELYTVGLVQLSNLMYRSCVHPVYSVTQFPVRIYGHFCTNTSSVVTEEWIPYLESILEGHSESQYEHFRLVSISALGKLGHIKALTPLVKIISGEITTKPLVRSVAVYSLKRVGKLNPSLIKPLLLAIIDNPAGNVEVRIAAVSVLPWCHPTTTELQKIAIRSWFEPSKQVSSFIYSTFKSLSETEVPALKAVGIKVRPLIHSMKPIEYGMQFSHNINYAVFVNYLRTAVSSKMSWVTTEDQLVPKKITSSRKIYNPSWAMRSVSFTIYTEGMDYLVDKLLYFPKDMAPVSESVMSQLEKIRDELKITRREEKPIESFLQMRLLDYEVMHTLNKEYIMEFLQTATESLRYQSHGFTEGKRFQLTRKVKAIEIMTIKPTAAGFALLSERNLPIVYSVKGVFKTEMKSESSLPIPTMLEVSMVPIMNMKMHTFMGIVSPFTKELIGSGVDAAVHLTTPIEVKLELSQMEQVSLTLKTPENVRKEVELVHVFIKPYTIKKDLANIRPMSHAKDIKIVYSGQQIKKMHYDLKRLSGISSKVIGESDNRYTDLYSYIEKIKQHSWVSLFGLGFMPSSLRYSTAKIEFSPNESEVKELVVRFSLTKALQFNLETNEEFEYPENYSDENMIKKVCKETFPSSVGDFERCRVQLKSLEDVSTEARKNCQRFSFHNPEDRERCYKTAQICEKAVEICESHHGPISSKCHEMKQVCYQRLVSSHRSVEVLKKMGNKSQVKSLRIDSQFKGPYSSRSVILSLHLGTKDEENGRYVKSYASIEIETPEKSTYEITFDSETRLPVIFHRWNKEKLLDEEIKLEFDGKLKYGVQGRNMVELVLKGVMEKTPEQKESVRRSVEFQKCSKQESLEWMLSPICMKVRHQAASLDKIVWTLQVPEEMRKSYLIESIQELIKSYFFTQIYYDHSDSSNASDEEYKFIVDFSRNGDEAQVEVEQGGLKWYIKNIRVHKILRGIFPLSLRNYLVDRLVQKVTHNQIPASCRIEPTYIGTFDNKTYSYEINNCMHLLFKDCHGKLPVAVLAKGTSERSQAKEIKILSGLTEIEMKPKSESEPRGMTIVAEINGQNRPIELTPGKVHIEKDSETGRYLYEIKMYQDMVYHVLFHNEQLEVITDGVRIEVIAPQLTRTRACGLCGDLNGENTADLKTPAKCLLKKDRFVAYSYMLKKDDSTSSGDKCSGIPSSDRSEYEREIRECVKKEEIITPLKELYHRLNILSKPLISVHLVEMQHDQICISKQKVKICVTPSLSTEYEKNYLEGTKPSHLKPKIAKFVCFSRPSIKGYSLAKRARSGEGLQDELLDYPIRFSKVVYEPISCKN